MARAKKSKKKSYKGLFSKCIIVFVIVANVVFTVKVLDLFEKTASEPATLITVWFAFTTTELLALASIKKKKVQNSDVEQYVEDDTEVEQ